MILFVWVGVDELLVLGEMGGKKVGSTSLMLHKSLVFQGVIFIEVF